MKTPDHVVAERIIQEFRDRKLLSEGGIRNIGTSLANGLLRPEDWRLAFEIDQEKETGNDRKNQ